MGVGGDFDAEEEGVESDNADDDEVREEGSGTDVLVGGVWIS